MTLLRKIAAVLLLLLFTATAAHAQDEGQTVGEWSVFTNANNCSAIRQFDGRVLWFAYSKSNDSGMVMAIDPVFGSVTNLKALPADLLLLNGTRTIARPAVTDSVGAVLDNGMKGIHIITPGGALLTSLAGADGVRVSSGTIVATFATGPMGAATAALRKCGDNF